MNTRITTLGLAMLAATAVQSAPALAQIRPGTQDVQIYAGELSGDRLTNTRLSGRIPMLDDNPTFGGRYTYDFARQWAVQLSAGYSPGRAADVAGGDSNLGLTTTDLDVLWYVAPGLDLGGHTLLPYTQLGVGYAWAHLDHPLRGMVGATPVVLRGSNGYTANIGFGARYYVTHSLFVDFDARYRYLSRLVNRHGQGLNTAATTLSLGYQF